MRANPVLREGVQVYLVEGEGFIVYFYLLVILAPIEFLTLFLPSLDPQAWMGPANLFKVASVAALLLVLYFSLRIANQEFVPWRFLTLRRWLQQEGVGMAQIAAAQIVLLALHVALLITLAGPFLLWAGAITRTPVPSMLIVFLLIFFYGLSYGVWGLAALALWEHRLETRQVFIRAFLFCLIVLSGLLYLPLNPVAFVLAYLERRPPAAPVHLLFHSLLLASGLLVYRWGLRREA